MPPKKKEGNPKAVLASDIISKFYDKELLKQVVKKKQNQTIHIDGLVEVHAEISIGKETEKVSTVNVLTIETLAMALHYAGVTREAALKAIIKSVIHKFKGNKKLSEKEMEIANAVDAMMGKLMRHIGRRVPKTKVSARITIDSSNVVFTDIKGKKVTISEEEPEQAEQPQG